jgi:hypothetical protein
MRKPYLTILIPLLLSITSRAHAKDINFLAEFVIPSSKPVFGKPFGGISAITYDSSKNLLYGLSDDRSRYAPSRFYSFKLKISKNEFSLQPEKLTELKNLKRKTYSFLEIDPEGMALLKDGSFLISTEGGRKLSINLARSEVLKFDSSGKKTGDIKIPTHFLPDKEFFPDRGTTQNRGFEGFSITPDGEYFFAATESPLIQDGEQPSSVKESLIRIIRYKKDNSNSNASDFIYDREWAYPLSPIPKQADSSFRGGIGVSEILAISETKIWVMERAYLGENISKIKIFEADFSLATDLRKLPSIKNKLIKAAKKELLLDVNHALKEKKLYPDNLEGMCFGPKLKNGSKTLILASDNNFKNEQKNQFLLFEIR